MSEGGVDTPDDSEGARQSDVTAGLIAELTRRHLSIAVAESLTGGLLTAELVRPAGASAVVRGSVVAYSTELKHSLLGVDAEVLAAHGPVDPDVARQMAVGVRHVLALASGPASIGVATTGVAGPGPHDGHPAGTVYIGLAIGNDVRSLRLDLAGTRDEIRSQTVSRAIEALVEALAE